MVVLSSVWFRFCGAGHWLGLLQSSQSCKPDCGLAEPFSGCACNLGNRRCLQARKKKLNAELANGRLAMFAIIGALAAG